MKFNVSSFLWGLFFGGSVALFVVTMVVAPLPKASTWDITGEWKWDMGIDAGALACYDQLQESTSFTVADITHRGQALRQKWTRAE